MEVVDRHEVDKDTYIETYRGLARKSGVNYVRAAGHGALDVMTLGLWEVAGTPLEGAISNNRGYILAKVVYPGKKANEAKKVEIYDAHGKWKLCL